MVLLSSEISCRRRLLAIIVMMIAGAHTTIQPNKTTGMYSILSGSASLGDLRSILERFGGKVLRYLAKWIYLH
jgi:hypothetical protein